MSDATENVYSTTEIELACWRIWYRLKHRGDCTAHNLMANCGIGESLFKEATNSMREIGMVEKAVSEDDRSVYTLREPQARMMQVFPTLDGGIYE